MPSVSLAPTHPRVAVIGGGPAGLMAAETLCAAGCSVDVYEAKASVGRKFLVAGKGGLNLTHSEPYPAFVSRYREAASWVEGWLRDFDADALRAWAREQGVETMIGSSGRVFPLDLKAAPLLRGWVRTLRERGVRFHLQHRWSGWDANGRLSFQTRDADISTAAEATVLALGGASWPELGSDGAWLGLLAPMGVPVAPLQPSNCGFECDWSEIFRLRHAGAPVKPAVISFTAGDGEPHRQQGEFIVTGHGIEGSLVYALSAPLRGLLQSRGRADLRIDLAPDSTPEALAHAIARPRGRRTLTEHLRRSTGLSAVKIGLLHEVLPRPLASDPVRLAGAIKALPLTLRGMRPIAEAISTAGGVASSAVDEHLMLRSHPGVFCAGEMLDWEAPTGGYLLTACFASGRHAGRGAAQWLQARR